MSATILPSQGFKLNIFSLWTTCKSSRDESSKLPTVHAQKEIIKKLSNDHLDNDFENMLNYATSKTLFQLVFSASRQQLTFKFLQVDESVFNVKFYSGECQISSRHSQVDLHMSHMLGTKFLFLLCFSFTRKDKENLNEV
ncbi:CLUMA_CG007045, isoform A [Clunio marinus]|uniref:CLUMA_CG007045, isoform A n=1 Tax=Clunio marinus TaxID=568069 RepID=A0A1J1HZI3_9DIPT|nr:CLUMA_CG007045, isoform A [Clunio marinus]